MNQVNRIARHIAAVQPDRQAPEVIDLVPVPPGPSHSQSLWAGYAVILMAFLAGILFGLLTR